MNRNCFIFYTYRVVLCVTLLTSAQVILLGQQAVVHTSNVNNKHNLFGNQGSFIQNVGQYGDTLSCYSSMGKILYGYEGLEMPVLFTPKGVIHLQKKQRYLTYEERMELMAAGVSKEERKKLTAPSYSVITIEWADANPDPQIIAVEKQAPYHTYGLIKEKAFAYSKIIYKDLYPGVDAVYSFEDAGRPGYNFSLDVKAGAELNKIKLKYGGETISVTTDELGQLIIASAVGSITQSLPLCYFPGEETKKQIASYGISQKEIQFKLPIGFTNTRSFIIDPFVTNTGTLTGIQAGQAKDIDYDYAGNIFVAGGGDAAFHKLAKYSPSGTLLWTFSGQLTTPVWNFGGSYGGWVVEKSSGAVYLGQGLMGSGFSVVRINSSGVYDNYISTPNPNFTENWKMTYSCNNGSPKILIAGGGGSANNELAILDPSSATLLTSNLSGLTGGHNDISDVVIDPVTNEMFTIYSTPVTDLTRDNLIFKHAQPYNSTTTIWQANAGAGQSLREPANRPYLQGLDNSSNIMAVNANYLFYWDGLSVKAFSKANGAVVGTATSFTGVSKLEQGGIYADECNNVYIGFTNGTIKVLSFNGTTFNDAVMADITIPGFTGNVYDLAYDNGEKLLYASGNGFVASLDISATCPSTIYDFNLNENCEGGTVQVTLNPVPPAGSSVVYELYDDAGVLISSNTTGFFTGLAMGEEYTIKVFINRQCGGTHVSHNFIFFANSPLFKVNNPAAVCPIVGVTDLTVPAITAGSAPGYTYSYWQNAQATIPISNPSVVSAGTYYIKATPANSNCYIIKKVLVPALPTPAADAGADIDICFGKNVQLNGTNGVSYLWSPSRYLDNPASQNPLMINPSPGNYIYTLHVVDAAGCRSLTPDTIRVHVDQPLRIKLPQDTIIVINQPLQLDAVDIDNSGFSIYTWTPSFGLNDPLIKNPVAILDRDFSYSVTASTVDDCKANASINIKVYKGPEIYVPTGFTPNNDGVNDIIKVVAVGLKQFHFFSIYNRWGQLVFTTHSQHIGWDGKVKGVVQDTGVFVWMTEGTDFNGNRLFKKGTLTLIK